MRANLQAWSLLVVAAVGFVLAGCAGGPGETRRARYQLGRPHYTVAPYQINGVWYYPRVDYSYDETGTASWYGPGFDHRATADGEIYDMNQLSAAHKTLPLPSVVEVTNLQNGRELRLRVNDRGPFVDGRVIDVSRRAAQLLGFERSGTAPVRVRILKEQSIEVAEAAMQGEVGPVMVAQAPRAGRLQMAAANPPPVIRPAANVPASLRATEVIGAPLPTAAVTPPTPPAAPAPPPALAPPPAVAQTPPQQWVTPPPQQWAAPPPAIAETRSGWPSLIASARAATLRAPFAAAAARRREPVREETSGRFFIQAGAFAVPENARRVQARIASLGRAEVVETTVHGAALYRVRLGPLGSETEAHRLLTEIAERGYPGARVVGE